MNVKLSYRVGNTLKRDHIQWPTITPAQASIIPDYGLRPIGVDVRTINALTWRVRRWRVDSADISVDADWIVHHGSPTRQEAHTLTSSFNMPEFFLDMGGEVERALIAIPLSPGTAANSGFSGGLLQNADITSHHVIDKTPPEFYGEPHEDVTFTESRLLQVNSLMFGADSFGSEFVTWDTITKLFYPYITVNGAIPCPAGFLFFSPSLTDAGHGSLTVNSGVVPEFDLPMRVTVLATELSGLAHVSTASCDLTMTAVKFWRYRNTLGQPCFNEDTGAQENDPWA